MSKDELLRREGFKIHSRPLDGQVWWERGGEIVNEIAAIRIADMEREKRRLQALVNKVECKRGSV